MLWSWKLLIDTYGKYKFPKWEIIFEDWTKVELTRQDWSWTNLLNSMYEYMENYFEELWASWKQLQFNADVLAEFVIEKFFLVAENTLSPFIYKNDWQKRIEENAREEENRIEETIEETVWTGWWETIYEFRTDNLWLKTWSWISYIEEPIQDSNEWEWEIVKWNWIPEWTKKTFITARVVDRYSLN